MKDKSSEISKECADLLMLQAAIRGGVNRPMAEILEGSYPPTSPLRIVEQNRRKN